MTWDGVWWWSFTSSRNIQNSISSPLTLWSPLPFYPPLTPPCPCPLPPPLPFYTYIMPTRSLTLVNATPFLSFSESPHTFYFFRFSFSLPSCFPSLVPPLYLIHLHIHPFPLNTSFSTLSSLPIPPLSLHPVLSSQCLLILRFPHHFPLSVSPLPIHLSPQLSSAPLPPLLFPSRICSSFLHFPSSASSPVSPVIISLSFSSF